MLSLLCTFLLPAMNGGRCHRRTYMEALEQSAEETSCPGLAVFPAELPEFGMDFFSQARKALSERSPFEVAEETSTSAAAVTLPSELGNLLNRRGDNRRRHKKSSHSGAGEKKKKCRANEKACGSNIWTEMEVYFRDLTLSDIDTLAEATSLYNLTYSECFSIPRLGNAPKFDVVSTEDERVAAPAFNLVSSENNEKVGSGNEKNAVEDANGVDMKIEDGFVGIESVDNVAVERDLPQGDKTHVSSDTCCSLEWLLGCRNKISLTSEHPSKKLKLLGGGAGLEKVVMAIPCDEGKRFCDYCSRGDTDSDSNPLIVCASCKVVVHQRCYGVQDNIDDSWLCSWCKQKGDIDDSENPCVLCPKKGGALKPVNGSVESVGSVQFAHLFCGLWMPEVYIDDLKKMEPIMNVGEINENKRRLVCNVCKVKFGACVRCSNGACGASFHPLCARAARHRMEVWAKYGDDDVELRAFCFKHSDLQENINISPSGDSVAIGEFSEANDPPVTLSVNSEHNLKVGIQNGVVSDSSPDKLNHNEPQDGGLSDCRLSAHDLLGFGAGEQHNIGVVGRTNENADASESLSFALVLKKLIDRGKVDAEDVALEIGISPDALTENINEAYMAPDVRDKIVNWLKAHVYTTAFQKGVKVKFKPGNASSDEGGSAHGSESLPKSNSGLLDPFAVKSVPPRRRTVSNIRILKDNKMICLSEGVTSENGMPVDKIRLRQPDHGNPGSLNEASVPDATEVNLTKSEDFCPAVQGNADKLFKSSISGCILDEESTVCLQNASMLSECPLIHPASEPPDSGLIKKETISNYVHPYIKKKLQQVHDGESLEGFICPREEGNSAYEFSVASDCSSSRNQQLTCIDFSQPNQVYKEQLARAKKMELLEFSPEDEVEGELIYYQHRLFQDRVAKKGLTDNLIHNIAKSLPQEIDMSHQRRWDAVIVNQYLRDLKEAKKRGRKERRHKEAQAVLAAATAAAAASTRSSFRKDTLDESMQQENLVKLDTLSGRTGASSQPMPRAKETLSRVAVTRTSSEKYSDFGMSISNFSKEQPKSCDICRRPETMLNPIILCSGCKVAVHLDCYRSVKDTVGPWYCELCENLSSRSSATSTINSLEKPYFVAECALCGGTTGAFRRSCDGQWVHAFCAEWVFESTFRRGQINAVEGVETLLKGTDICCICCCKHGVCMKCCYGHCRTTFHPYCARNAGLYMNVRTTGGKLQHKAYCQRHSLEQKEKAETQKHGIEEFKRMKQIRVELERLRLLCERIVKREKIKRELIICSHNMLAFKRDHVARSMLVHSPFILPDGSSESATTSLKGNTEGYRSCSEAVQQSDDVTVDSSVSAKHRVRVAVSMDTDPKVDDDCSTSQSQYKHKIPERMQFSGKQIPRRASATLQYHSDEGGRRSKSRKHAETFGKELVMTSDEASMKNSRLPKGYAYVPADCLSNDKHSNEDVYASEPVE